MGNVKLEPVIFYNPGKLPTMGWIYSPATKSSAYKSILPGRCSGEMVAQKLWEWPKITNPTLRPMPQRKLIPDTAWMTRNQRLDCPKPKKRTKQDLEKEFSEMLTNDILLYLWKRAGRFVGVKNINTIQRMN